MRSRPLKYYVLHARVYFILKVALVYYYNNNTFVHSFGYNLVVLKLSVGFRPPFAVLLLFIFGTFVSILLNTTVFAKQSYLFIISRIREKQKKQKKKNVNKTHINYRVYIVQWLSSYDSEICILKVPPSGAAADERM